jgi:hypothetical protein
MHHKSKSLLSNLALRFDGGKAYWHNRLFPLRLHAALDHRGVHLALDGRVLRAGWYSALRDQFTGTCHIVVSGPSVQTIRDPTRLCSHFNIWANGSPALALEHQISPDLYVTCDTGFLERQLSTFVRYSERSSATLLSFTAAATLLRFGTTAGSCYLYDDTRKPFRLPVNLPRLDANAIVSGHSVAVICVNAALDLGFRDLRIFGLDLGGGRFYAEQKAEPSSLDKNFESICDDFRRLRKLADEKEARILNCSPHSRLPESIFERSCPNRALE